MITLFLGAGASKSLGFPTTEDFMKDTYKTFSNNRFFKEITDYFKKSNLTIDIEKVLWEIQKLDECIVDIEEKNTFKKWFFVDSSRGAYKIDNTSFNFAQQLINTRSTIKGLISEINKLVYDTYWKEVNIDKGFYGKFLGILTQLSSINDEKNRIDIFTTNYDLVIERALEKKREIFSDGFATDASRSSCWDMPHYGDKRIRLFKLHGSIDWKKFNNDKVYCIPGHDFTRHEDHVILYPGFKGEPVQEPFISIHNEFKKSLLSSDKCIFVGFSFRDEYINKIILDSLNENKRLQLIIWNPVIPNLSFPEHRILHHKEAFEIKLETIDAFEQFLNKRTKVKQKGPAEDQLVNADY